MNKRKTLYTLPQRLTKNYFLIVASIYREIEEVLGLLMKKGNHLGQTSYLRALWIRLEGNTLALLAILIGVIGMVYAKQTKVFCSQHSYI
jgi:hypothetical protein